MKLEEAITQFLRHLKNVKNVSPYTIRNYKRSLGLFAGSVGNIELEEINLGRIDDFRDKIFELKS